MGLVLFSVDGIDQLERFSASPSGRNAHRDAQGAAAVASGSAHTDLTGGADDPDRSRLSRHPAAPTRADLDLLDCA